MNKTTKIIIAFAVAIAIAATVLVVSLVGNGGIGKEEESTTQGYYLQPTTTMQNIYNNTESWVDLNMIASDLAATATDTSALSTEPSTGSLIVTSVINNIPATSIVYVDQNGNIIDPNSINKNTTAPTQIANTEVFDTVATDVDSNGEFGEFKIDANGVITEYLGTKELVVIPQTEQNKKVTGIGDGCFEGTSVKAVYISAGVKTIGKKAFANCSYLESVHFLNMESTVTIKDCAFQNCVSLKSVSLPKVKSIGRLAFDNCTSLKEVSMENGSEAIGDYCFSNCKALMKITIPQSVTAEGIGTNPFKGCDYTKLIIYCAKGSDIDDYADTEKIMVNYL